MRYQYVVLLLRSTDRKTREFQVIYWIGKGAYFSEGFVLFTEKMAGYYLLDSRGGG